MSTNTEAKQTSLRAKTGKALDYCGDFHAYWDFLGTVPAGTFNERMVAWINAVLSSSYVTMDEAQQAYAANKGANNWDSLGSLGLP